MDLLDDQLTTEEHWEYQEGTIELAEANGDSTECDGTATEFMRAFETRFSSALNDRCPNPEGRD
jgi:hypothetical protein